MVPTLDIPITLELAQAAYPQYNWTLGYRLSDDYLTVTRTPMYSEGTWKRLLKWTHTNINHDHPDGIATYRWVLSIVSVDSLCYLTREEMSNELSNSVTEYERKKRVLSQILEQSGDQAP